jgi:hypothetical protein
MAHGDRSHGAKGILEYYAEFLGTNDPMKVAKFLPDLTQGKGPRLLGVSVWQRPDRTQMPQGCRRRPSQGAAVGHRPIRLLHSRSRKAAAILRIIATVPRNLSITH